MLLDDAVKFLAFIEQEFRPDGQAGEGDAFQAMKCRMPVEPRHVFFGGYYSKCFRIRNPCSCK